MKYNRQYNHIHCQSQQLPNQYTIIPKIDHMSRRSNVQRPTAIDRSKRKTLFQQLVTDQEQKINYAYPSNQEKPKSKSQRYIASSNRLNSSKIDAEDMDELEDIDIDVSKIQHVNSEHMVEVINTLIAKNKINAKNAFDVPIIHLQQTKDFKDVMNEYSWKNLSSTLENDYKIYGYRVDATHNITYRMLEAMNRREDQDQTNQLSKPELKDRNSLSAQIFNEEIQSIYGNFLERNLKNINIVHLDSVFNVNPMLERTKRKFDQVGLKGLLLNNMELNQNFNLEIFLNKKVNANSQSEVHQEFNFQESNFFIQLAQQQNAAKIETIYRQIHQINKFKEDDEDSSQHSNQSEVSRQQFYSMWKEVEDYETQFQNKMPKDKKLKSLEVKNDQQGDLQPTNAQMDIEKQISPAGQIQKMIDENEEPLPNNQKSHTEIQKSSSSSDSESNSERKNEKSEPKIDQCKQEIIVKEEQKDSESNHSTNQLFKEKNIDLKKMKTISEYINVKGRSDNQNKQKRRRKLNDAGEDVADQLQQWNKDKLPNEKSKNKRIKSRPKFEPNQNIDFDAIKERASNIWQVTPYLKKIKKEIKKQFKRFSKQIKNKIPEHERYSIDSLSFVDINLSHNYCLRDFDCSKKSTIKENIVEIPMINLVQENQEGIQPKQIEGNQLPEYILLDDDNNTFIVNSQNISKKILNTISIKNAKDKLKCILFQPNDNWTFQNLYDRFINKECYISQALCFLTLLHLGNEHNLEFLEIQKLNDFAIRKPGSVLIQKSN